jgi:isoquinoline 1-oxidoreductase
VRAEWDAPASAVDDQTIFDHLLKVAPPATTLESAGDVARGKKLATRTLEATYLNAYVAHAPMETHTALARVERGRATVWASTQSPFGLRDEAAELLGVAPARVHVITPYLGGGFGGKSHNGQALEALRLARAASRPVQVCWSRAEEFFYDTFRPAAIVKIRAGLDGRGAVVLWDYSVYYAGERGAPLLYAFPHHRTSVHGGGWRAPAGSHPFATGAWRAPGNNTNTFARESHLDMLAAAAGVDPVEFRLRHLEERRLAATLKAAAARFGWKPAKGPSGRGWGVAIGTDAGTYVATLAEVRVDAGGLIRVERIVHAQDMGVVVNPEGARNQVEGAITMGLGYTLTEELRFRGGKITDDNFDTYQLPRFSHAPKIETVFIDSDLPPQGGGEPAIIGVGAAIANAVYDATGARLYQLPLLPERVKEARARLPT